jgi:hypothetical protein
MPTGYLQTKRKLADAMKALSSKTARRKLLSSHWNYLRIKGVPSHSLPAMTVNAVDVKDEELVESFGELMKRIENQDIELAPPGTIADKLSLLKPFRNGPGTVEYVEYAATEKTRRTACVEEARVQVTKQREAEASKKESLQEKRAAQKSKKEQIQKVNTSGPTAPLPF